MMKLRFLFQNFQLFYSLLSICGLSPKHRLQAEILENTMAELGLS